MIKTEKCKVQRFNKIVCFVSTSDVDCFTTFLWIQSGVGWKYLDDLDFLNFLVSSLFWLYFTFKYLVPIWRFYIPVFGIQILQAEKFKLKLSTKN